MKYKLFLIFSAEKPQKDLSDIRTDFSLDDLNFDPAALIGEGNGDWNVSLFYADSWTYGRTATFIETYPE